MTAAAMATMDEPTPVSPAEDPAAGEAPGEAIGWESLAPYVSLRLFEHDDLGIAWTPGIYRRAAELAQCLVPFARYRPPSSPRRKSAADSAGALGLSGLGATFFDLASGDLADSFVLDPAADLSALDSRLTADHALLVGFWYRVLAPPAWLQTPSDSAPPLILDTRHHLALLAVLPPYLALTCTQAQMLKKLSGLLQEGQAGSLRLSAPLAPVPDRTLEAAFVDGEAYHLWLSGLHRSVATKPDRKFLSGLDLRLALDPYSEQTFAYRAVISRLKESEAAKRKKTESSARQPPAAVGFSRAGKTVWMSKSAGIVEFARTLAHFRELLRAVDARLVGTPTPLEVRRKATALGLNILSQPIPAASIGEARDPFEVHLDLDDPKEEGEAPGGEHGRDCEDWRASGMLELAPADAGTAPATDGESPLLPVRAYFAGSLLAHLWLRVVPAGEEGLRVEIVRMRPTNRSDPESFRRYEMLSRLTEARGRNVFTIRYETGHVLEGRHLYRPEYRDVLFQGWKAVDLQPADDPRKRTFEVQMEKPEGWLDGGWRKRRNELQRGKSLFARVILGADRLLGTPPGTAWHLLCHDQANEVADFVYIEPEGRRIVLIHVKGAHSDQANRRVSIDAYQVVAAQAIKNLRHLDKDVLYSRLAAPPKKGAKRESPGFFQLCSCHPGRISEDTKEFVAALERLQKGLPVIHKKVVIFQPHVRHSYWQKLQGEYEKAEAPRELVSLRPAFMLSALLIEAEIACRKLGCEFEVWCDSR